MKIQPLNLLKKLFKRKPKTFSVRFYHKHTDDHEYYLMNTHMVNEDIFRALTTAVRIDNSPNLHYNIDKITYDMSNNVYILNTSTFWSPVGKKPSCYTNEWFIKN